jgi:hypothetical protein
MSTEERVARLERMNRVWRWLVVGLALVLTSVVACNQGSDSRPVVAVAEKATADEQKVEPIHERLRVRNIQVLDRADRVVGEFGAPLGSTCSLWVTCGRNEDHESTTRTTSIGPLGIECEDDCASTKITADTIRIKAPGL